MDWDNLSAMQQQCPKAYQHKLMLLMRFANEFEEATVPDPYGGADGFGKVLDYLEDACQGVLELVRKRALNTRRPEPLVRVGDSRPGLNWQ